MAETAPTSAYPARWSAIYDLSDFDRRPWRDFYRSLVGPEVGSLLDLGCGTGSITLDLAARMAPGARVAGVDLSSAMIAIARARAPWHDWQVGDIAAPPVQGRYDRVFLMFNTLQYLLDRDQIVGCFRAVAERLAPGALFAFDIANPNPDWLARTNGALTPSERVTDIDGRVLEVRESRRYDPALRILSLVCTLHDAETGALVDAEPLTLRYRQLFPQELPELLAAGGLALKDCFGDLDRSPFGPGARRQVCLCGLA